MSIDPHNIQEIVKEYIDLAIQPLTEKLLKIIDILESPETNEIRAPTKKRVVKRTTRTKDILKIMQKAPVGTVWNWLTINRASAASGAEEWSPGDITNSLVTLVSQGKIRRVAHGLYEIVDNVEK